MLTSRSIMVRHPAHCVIAILLVLVPIVAFAQDRPEHSGDMNADGEANGLDIQPFIVAIQQASVTPGDIEAADFSDDGVINPADIPGMTSALLEAPTIFPLLVAHWPLDEGGPPDIADDATGHHDGILHGPVWTADARFGGGLSFDGINDYVEIGHLDFVSDWTLCFWVQPMSTDRPAYYPVGLNTAQAGVIAAGATASVKQRIVLDDGDNKLPGITPSVLGEWYHVAVTKEGLTYQVCRDGVLEATGELNDIKLNAFQLSRRADGFGDFQGTLDDVAVWRCALPLGDPEDPEPGSINFARLNGVAGPAVGQAYNPSPIDHTRLVRLRPQLRWRSAYEHDDVDHHRVYIGVNYEDVSQGLVPYISTTAPIFEPDKLAPDTTYYWRVDEVLLTKTICPGRVWRFTTGSILATNPYPANEEQAAELAPLLAWTSGADTVEAAGHVVYISDCLAEVAARLPEACLGSFDESSCQSPHLRRLTDYYWCVDEIDMDGTTLDGEIWCFTTRLAPSMPNADIPLITPTYEGSGQGMHPDVKYFPTGWNGYEYWMAMTPHPFSLSEYENPSILASHDGLSWEVPPGLTNPLVLSPEWGYNADTDLVYNDDEDELWVYFLRCFEDQSLVKLALMRSADGVTWSEPEYLITWDISIADNERSYAIIKQGSDWHYWAEVRGITGPVVYRHSTDGRTWSAPQSITCTPSPPGLLWHLDVTYVPSQSEYWMLFNIFEPGQLYLARSTDRINWSIDRHPVLSPREGSWDDTQLYRSTLMYDETMETLRIWYSGRNAAREWHTGYSQGTYRMEE